MKENDLCHPESLKGPPAFLVKNIYSVPPVVFIEKISLFAWLPHNLPYKKTMKRSTILLLSAALLLLTTSCIPGDGAATPEHPANFLWGIWHGWVAPISLIISLFKDHIGIYEVHNTGFWYNLGYYMAIVGGFGSLSLARKQMRKK